MKRVLIPGVILCGADVAQAVDDKNMYMHVFEEMTVYAPVPVPVNGNTHYTSESIERLPTGNGNISDLLRTNPAVRMDSTQSTSLNQGDIRPEKISIHGASPYQNAYLIDGISATNNLNPANESDASSATNISGMSQGYYLDVSLLDNVTLYDSFVPVEFGRFNGGVIDAKIKRFNADDSKVKLGYRTTRSDWLTSHIDENNKSAFNQGSSGSTYYSPDFKKNFYTLSFNQELADNFGVTAGLSRRQSDITRADYVSNDGIVAGRAQYKNVIDTALSKFTWFASDRFTHDLTLKYTGSSRDYNTSTFPQSDREMGNKSYGLAWDMDTQLAWAKLRTTVGWDHISDYTRHDHDIWYTELSCTYGDITGRCRGWAHRPDHRDHCRALFPHPVFCPAGEHGSRLRHRPGADHRGRHDDAGSGTHQVQGLYRGPARFFDHHQHAADLQHRHGLWLWLCELGGHKGAFWPLQGY